MNENTEPSVPWSAFKKDESNSLRQVRYKDWDGLRVSLYDIFGWYMSNLQKLERLSDYEGLTMEAFVIECLNHGLETFDERYENCTRG